MPFFKCLLKGENFVVLGPRDELKMVDVVATRFVEAADANEAELKCVDLIRADKQWDNIDIRANLGSAQIYMDEITEIDVMPKSGTGEGYTFFRQKNKGIKK